MQSTTNHPAYLSHVSGKSVTYSIGRDYTAYLVSLACGEYILTEWANGKIGIQKV